MTDPLLKENDMNLLEELRPQIEAFTDTRDRIVDTISLSPVKEDMSCGEPPFAVDDGTSLYAIIDEDEKVRPLPFGYQLSDEDMQEDGVDYLLSVPVAAAGGGMNIARYIPLVEDFKVPGERAFCLETAEDSEEWETVGEAVGQIQKIVNDRAQARFNQEWSFMVGSLYDAYEEIESVDQAVAVAASDPSILLNSLLRCYQHALEAIEEEIDTEGDYDDE